MAIQLEIIKTVPPGDGFGYYKDKAVFVPCTTVGDVVEVSIVKEKKRHITAALVKVLTPGKKRVDAPCPHYQVCGGCSLMHLSYSDQIELKQKMLMEVFTSQQLCISPTFTPSSHPFRYRYRTTLKLKDGIIGFSARQSHQIVAIDQCQILSQGIRDQLNRLSNLGRIHCEFSLLESSHSGSIAASVTENNRLVALPGYPFQIEEDYGFGLLNLQSDSFAQSNPNITSTICKALEAEVESEDQICELYCGSGTFSLPLAQKAGSLTGYDISEKSIQAAKKNALANNLNNTEFKVGNLEKGTTLGNCSAIVVDPPRKGLGTATLKQIGNSKASKLLYVSCNPSSLARDCKTLVNSYDFALCSVTGYDMYCHSHHSEALAILSR